MNEENVLVMHQDGKNYVRYEDYSALKQRVEEAEAWVKGKKGVEDYYALKAQLEEAKKKHDSLGETLIRSEQNASMWMGKFIRADEELSKSREREGVMRANLSKLISVVATVNYGKHHELKIPSDDEPVLVQRKEWVEYLLEENKKAEDALKSMEGEK